MTESTPKNTTFALKRNPFLLQLTITLSFTIRMKSVQLVFLERSSIVPHQLALFLYMTVSTPKNSTSELKWNPFLLQLTITLSLTIRMKSVQLLFLKTSPNVPHQLALFLYMTVSTPKSTTFALKRNPFLIQLTITLSLTIRMKPV
jgi:hypothetical protein